MVSPIQGIFETERYYIKVYAGYLLVEPDPFWHDYKDVSVRKTDLRGYNDISFHKIDLVRLLDHLGNKKDIVSADLIQEMRNFPEFQRVFGDASIIEIERLRNHLQTTSYRPEIKKVMFDMLKEVN